MIQIGKSYTEQTSIQGEEMHFDRNDGPQISLSYPYRKYSILKEILRIHDAIIFAEKS